MYAKSPGGTDRDRQRFKAEAIAAEALLQTMPNGGPARFVSGVHNDTEDRWLSAVAALIPHQSSFQGSGHDENGRHVSGHIDNLVGASKLACARLAVGDVPVSGRLTPRECAHIAHFISDIDKVVNEAVSSHYSAESVRRVEAVMTDIGDWLAINVTRRTVLHF